MPLALGGNTVTVSAADPSGPGATASLPILRDPPAQGGDLVLQWHAVVRHAIANDASGPPAGSRALAMESMAVHDTLNAISGTKGYLVSAAAPAGASAQTAVAAAADAMLDLLYPGQSAAFDAMLAAELGRFRMGRPRRTAWRWAAP